MLELFLLLLLPPYFYYYIYLFYFIFYFFLCWMLVGRFYGVLTPLSAILQLYGGS